MNSQKFLEFWHASRYNRHVFVNILLRKRTVDEDIGKYCFVRKKVYAMKIWEFFENMNECVYASDIDTDELVYMNKRHSGCTAFIR